MIQKGTKDVLKLKLSYQNSNYEDYKAILSELGLYAEAGFRKPANLGNRRLSKAYQYLRNRISGLDYQSLLENLEKANSATMVKIEVDSHADAYTLFESLNNRGVPLSAMDLVKNRLLSRLEKIATRPVDKAYDEWVSLVENLPDYSYQERFLRQYYNAFRYDPRIRLEGFSRATRSTLIKIFDRLVDKDAVFMFDELVSKAKTYHAFIQPSKESIAGYSYDGLVDLLRVGGVPSYTFLLYLLSQHDETKELIEATIRFLVKYFARRNLTDYPETRALDSIFTNLIDRCEEVGVGLSFKFIVDYLTTESRFAGFALLKQKLQGDIYEENTDMARFILCRIEENHKTKEIFADLWDRDRHGKYLWTIEHIFPEGKNIPTEWINMIGAGDEERTKQLQQNWVHKLGNLTLTGYNPALSNLSFEKKRNRQDEKGSNIGYKNGLYLNRELAVKNSWTIDDIEKRTSELTEEALKLFEVAKGEL